MTPPGGSRDDDASAPRGAVPAQDRAGAPEDAPEPASAGEPGSDPPLRAMRAVWLEMRDEEPPDRGLAALLAAARHQAEAMQPRPSAWQRLLAALRRPPVLALATVTVLIAGAVLIGGRVSREAAPAVRTSQDHGAGPSISTPLDRPTHRTRQAAERDDALAFPAPQPAAPPPAAAPPPPERDRVPPAPPVPRATTPSSPSTARVPPGEAPRKDDDRASAGLVPADPSPEPPPPPPERPTHLGASGAVSGDGTSGGNNAHTAGHPARAEPPAQPAGGTSNDTTTGAANRTPTTAANRTPTTAANNAANGVAGPAANGVANPVANGAAPKQRPSPAPRRPDAAGDPYRQCETAAGRGDCATVRRLVDQITRTDPGYRDRVAKDSPVGKCLAE